MAQTLQLSPLEELALEGLKTALRVKAGNLLSGNGHQAERLKELTKDAPRIAAEYVNYILSGENSVTLRQGKQVWPLYYADVELTIALLGLLGKEPQQISDMLVAAFSAEPTNSGKVKKYSTAISGENRLRLKGTYPDIHRGMWERLAQVITPKVMVDAVAEIQEWNTEYIWDPKHNFGRLKDGYDRLVSGKLKEELIGTYFGERSKPYQFEKRTFAEKMAWLDEQISQIFKHSPFLYDADRKIRIDVVQPLERVLDDFREELGMPHFEKAGYVAYGSPDNSIRQLRHDVEKMEEKVGKDFRPLVEEIRKEKEREFRKQAVWGPFARY